MLYIAIVTCLCALFLVARSLILVSSGTIAIRKTNNHFRGLAPGIHFKWPWQGFVRYDFHVSSSDTQTYCVSSEDGARVHIRIAVEWTEFQRVCHRSTLNLIAPIRITIGKYPVDVILCSPKIRNEVEWAVRSTSHETGHFFFKLEVLSILREELFEPLTHEQPPADTEITLPPVHTLQTAPSPREPLRCIHGGKHGEAYRSRHRPRSPSSPHLRLFRGGRDDGVA